MLRKIWVHFFLNFLIHRIPYAACFTVEDLIETEGGVIILGGETEIMGEKSCVQNFSPIISSTMPKKKAVNSNQKGVTIAR